MTTTRRTFMRQVGVTLAGLLVSGCVPPASGGTSSSAGTPAPTATPGTPLAPTAEPPTCYAAPAPTYNDLENEGRWQEVRACWLELCARSAQARCEPGFTADLRRRYASSLSALVAGRGVDATVAGHVGVAFEEAVTHFQRKQATCYEPLPQDTTNPYPPREEVVTQAAALAEMAGRSGIAPETIATAQAVLARDMAWLDQFRVGGNPSEMAAVEATPSEIEAARVLVALLLKTE